MVASSLRRQEARLIIFYNNFNSLAELPFECVCIDEAPSLAEFKSKLQN